MKRSFSTFIALLLFTLMFFKVSSFHAYTHDSSDTSDEIENCNICELAAEIQDNEFVVATQIVFTTPLLTTNTYEPVSSYDLVLSSSFLRSNFFGRPPPTCA